MSVPMGKATTALTQERASEAAATLFAAVSADQSEAKGVLKQLVGVNTEATAFPIFLQCLYLLSRGIVGSSLVALFNDDFIRADAERLKTWLDNRYHCAYATVCEMAIKRGTDYLRKMGGAKEHQILLNAVSDMISLLRHYADTSATPHALLVRGELVLAGADRLDKVSPPIALKQPDGSTEVKTPKMRVFSEDEKEQGMASAFSSLCQAASAGNMFAEHLVGLAVFNGDMGAEADPQQGYERIFRAASAGVVKAMISLGDLLSHGTHEQCQEAIIWYSKASDLMDASARRKLGVMFLQGVGTKQDRKRAQEILKDAAELGDETAADLLSAVIHEDRQKEKKAKEAAAKEDSEETKEEESKEEESKEEESKEEASKEEESKEEESKEEESKEEESKEEESKEASEETKEEDSH